MALQHVPQAQDTAGPQARAVPRGLLAGLTRRLNRAWAGVFLSPLGIVDAGEHAEALEDVRTAA